MKMKRKNTESQRTQVPMTVRLVHVEPSDHTRAIIDRVWTLLLGEPEESGADRPSRRLVGRGRRGLPAAGKKPA